MRSTRFASRAGALVAGLALASACGDAGPTSPTTDPALARGGAAANNGRIVYTAFGSGAGTQFQDVFSMSPDGGGVTRITNSADPDWTGPWSPNGNQVLVAIQKGADPYQLFIVNADGTGATAVGPHPSLGWLAGAWSKDGKQLVTTLRVGNQGDVHTMNTDGSNIRRISFTGTGFDPDWSPDGKRIAFVSLHESVAGEIYVMNTDGSRQTRLTYDGGTFPSWAPGGKQIAFVRAGNIWVMNADGSAQRAITAGATDQHPSWSDDGKFIVFNSFRDGNSELYRVEVDGGGVTRLTYTETVSELEPHWRR
jgi:TolB protein